MAAVGVRELKNRLPHYLRSAKRGEEIIVTERGRPIALLQSIEAAGRAVTRDARLARLAALGLVTLPSGRRLKRIERVKNRGRSVASAVAEDRR